MPKKILASIVCVFIVFTMLASELSVGKVDKSPKIDGEMDQVWEKVPWNNNFFELGSAKKAATQTRFKICHNEDSIFFLVECLEPKMDKLREDKAPAPNSLFLWKYDSIELNIVADPGTLCYYKLMLTSSGEFTFLEMRDANMGNGQFTSNPINSLVHTAVIKKDKSWFAEAKIPFCVLNLGEFANPGFKFNVGRNRYADEVAQYSSFSRLSKVSHCLPHEFSTANLEKFTPNAFAFLVREINGKVEQANSQLLYKTELTISNLSPEYVNLSVQGQILDVNGKIVGKDEKTLELVSGANRNIKLNIPLETTGKYHLRFIVKRLSGRTMFFSDKEENFNFEPLKVAIVRPAYRNVIFHTMTDKTLEVAIKAEIPEIKSVEIRLSNANNFLETKQVKLNDATTLFHRSFEDLPDGDYTLKITANESGKDYKGVDTVIRKLPFLEGEVWLDRSGAPHVNGKLFVPHGWFRSPIKVLPGMNIMQSYTRFRSKAEAVKFLDNVHKVNMKVFIFPFYENTDWKYKIFANSERKGKMTAEQRKLAEELILAVRNHPALFGYYMADEPENHEDSPLWYEELRELIIKRDPYHPCLMLNQDYNAIARYIKGADISFPDCYPDYIVNGASKKPPYTLSAFSREATRLRPVWMAPQAFCWNTRNPKQPSRPPTFEELRNQMYQCFANGVKGIIWYCYDDWSQLYHPLRLSPEFLGYEINAIQEFIAATPVLNEVSFSVAPADPNFQISLKQVGNDIALFAVNTSYEKRNLGVSFKSLRPSELFVLSGDCSIKVTEGKFNDAFKPLEVKIYLTNKSQANKTSLAEISAIIAKAEQDRKKSGNVVAIGERIRDDYEKNIMQHEPNTAKITASSEIKSYFTFGGTLYFLFDGIAENSHWQYTWTPNRDDRNPWVRIVLPHEKKIKQVNLFTYYDEKTGANLTAAELWAVSSGKKIKLADFQNNVREEIELRFPPVLTTELEICIKGAKPGVCRENSYLLSEIEVYE